MKKLIWIFLLASVSFSSAAQETQIDGMLVKILDALKNKDEEAFLRLFPTRQQFITMIRLAFPEDANDLSDSVLGVKLGPDEAGFQKAMRPRFSGSFKRLIKMAEEKNIDLSTIQYDSHIYQIKKEEGNVKIASGIINLSTGGKNYELKYSDMVWLPKDSAWFGVDLKGIILKGEKWDNTEKISDSTDVEVRDVIVTQAEDPLPPPPPRPPKRKANEKIKVKSKTKGKS
jgi:hypothetical protein